MNDRLADIEKRLASCEARLDEIAPFLQNALEVAHQTQTGLSQVTDALTGRIKKLEQAAEGDAETPAHVYRGLRDKLARLLFNDEVQQRLRHYRTPPDVQYFDDLDHTRQSAYLIRAASILSLIEAEKREGESNAS